MEALIREQQREEQRKIEAEELAKREEEAEKRHNEKMEEVIRKRKAKEEQQTKQRQEEEKNWTLAMSGELSGPRQAALGAVQGVVETQHLIDVDDKDEVLHTAMYKGQCIDYTDTHWCIYYCIDTPMVYRLHWYNSTQ